MNHPSGPGPLPGTAPGPEQDAQAAPAVIVNGRSFPLGATPARRLADWLRDDIGLTGTKLGCSAGDCGACTVLIDGEQACACIVPVGQCAGAHRQRRVARGGRPSPRLLGLSLQAALRSDNQKC